MLFLVGFILASDNDNTLPISSQDNMGILSKFFKPIDIGLSIITDSVLYYLKEIEANYQIMHPYTIIVFLIIVLFAIFILKYFLSFFAKSKVYFTL